MGESKEWKSKEEAILDLLNRSEYVPKSANASESRARSWTKQQKKREQQQQSEPAFTGSFGLFDSGGEDNDRDSDSDDGSGDTNHVAVRRQIQKQLCLSATLQQISSPTSERTLDNSNSASETNEHENGCALLQTVDLTFKPVEDDEQSSDTTETGTDCSVGGVPTKSMSAYTSTINYNRHYFETIGSEIVPKSDVFEPPELRSLPMLPSIAPPVRQRPQQKQPPPLKKRGKPICDFIAESSMRMLRNRSDV